MSIRFRCAHPDCTAEIVAEDSLARQVMDCPGCGRRIRIPAPPSRPVTGILIDGPENGADPPYHLQRTPSPATESSSAYRSASAEAIRFSCPGCGAVYAAPGDKAGKKTKCPKCGQRMQLPDPAEQGMEKTQWSPVPPPMSDREIAIGVGTESPRRSAYPIRRGTTSRHRILKWAIAGFVVVLIGAYLIPRPESHVGDAPGGGGTDRGSVLHEGRTISEWVEWLGHHHPVARREAREALRWIGPPAVPALANALDDADPEIRTGAAYVLGKIGSAANPAIPALADTLSDENLQVRRNVAEALSQMGPDAAAAIPALIGALRDEDFFVVSPSIAALVNVGKPAVPDLDKALRDADKEARRHAAIALGRIGPAAKGAVPALANALNDKDEEVREAVATALVGIGPDAKAAVPELTRAIKDEDLRVCEAAVWALSVIGPDAKAAIPALIDLIRDEGGSLLGNQAESALRAIDPDAARQAGIR